MPLMSSLKFMEIRVFQRSTTCATHRFDARNSIGRYLDFYNSRRPHLSLDGITPDQAYFTPLPLRAAA